MRVADHIHLRCPSNIGLLLFVQILFLKRLSPLNMPVIGILNQKALVVSIATMDKQYFLNQKYESFSVWSLGWSVSKYLSFFTASYSEMDKVRLFQKITNTD
jgi:hypothetical protein